MKAKINLEEPMLRISIGYKHLVLPWTEGMQVFNALKSVRFVESSYESNGQVWKLVKEDLTCALFTPAEQAQLLMGGGSDENK